MKHEGLIHAIGALDDDLLTEALEPLPKETRKPTALTRCLMLAACLALVVFGAVSLFSGGTALKLEVEGNVLREKEPVELSLLTTARQSSGGQRELTLNLSCGKETWQLSCGEGCAFWDDDGQLCTSLTVSGEREVSWILDLSAGQSFTLTARGTEETMLVTAILTQDGEGVLLTAEQQK